MLVENTAEYRRVGQLRECDAGLNEFQIRPPFEQKRFDHLLVIADHTARADQVAADLLAQAEHAPGASILVTWSEAAAGAAKLRFRAVLMTAISFICGTIPLVLASGAGAASRKALGVTVVGGMTLSCILGTLLVPGLYVIIQKIVDFSTRKTRINK